MNEVDVRYIVEGLFSTHPMREKSNNYEEDNEEVIPEFTEEELLTAVDSLKNGKKPGLYGILTEILKIATHAGPQLISCMYNTSTRSGVFSKLWKRTKLVLISKGQWDPRIPNYWRSLRLLNTAGKSYDEL